MSHRENPYPLAVFYSTIEKERPKYSVLTLAVKGKIEAVHKPSVSAIRKYIEPYHALNCRCRALAMRTSFSLMVTLLMEDTLA